MSGQKKAIDLILEELDEGIQPSRGYNGPPLHEQDDFETEVSLIVVREHRM